MINVYSDTECVNNVCILMIFALWIYVQEYFKHIICTMSYLLINLSKSCCLAFEPKSVYVIMAKVIYNKVLESERIFKNYAFSRLSHDNN